MRQRLGWIAIMLLLVLPGLAAAQVTITPGDFTTAGQDTPSDLGAQSKLSFTVTDFTTNDQFLQFMYQISNDGGVTWRDWTGATVQAPMQNRQHQLVNTRVMYSGTPPEALGNLVLLRMTGTLTSGIPITLMFGVTNP